MNRRLVSSLFLETDDVVDIDEDAFQRLIQECTEQPAQYGDHSPLAINFKLLETRLSERYICGRNFIAADPIEFEFIGQSNIPQVLARIDRIHAINEQRNPERCKYFIKAPSQLLSMIKLNIQRTAAYIKGNNVKKKKKMNPYSAAKNAVEQVLIAMKHQRDLPRAEYSLGNYMKDHLHLYPIEYDPFIRTQQLQLKHLESVWRYLEKLQLIEDGTWHEIPECTTEMYKHPIDDDSKTALMQFVTMHDMDDLWQFLMAFRRFLRDTCRTPLSENPEYANLIEYLGYAVDIDEELVDVFPNAIKLNQAGWAYYHAARNYQQRLREEEQQ